MVAAGEAGVEGYVDLGLPSGILWCDHNIGGTNPEDYGYYFSWGNVDGHEKDSGYDFRTYSYYATLGFNLTGNIPINETYDIARNDMGSPWRLPTKDEIQELYDNTYNEWTTINGVAGRKFMKKSDSSVYVFFPACGCYGTSASIEDSASGVILNDEGISGYYWTSTYKSNGYDGLSYIMVSESSLVYPDSTLYRHNGASGRAVCKPMFSIIITLTGDSVSGITVTVTDSEGISHSGTTDSNGVVQLTGVAGGSAIISAVGYVFTPYSINVNSSSRTFTIGCEYAFVDLGLPSGLLWAKGNLVKDSQGNYYIGAETDYGTYVSWGNIDGHNDGELYNFNSTTYNSTPGKQVTANISSTDATHDIAFARLGAPWHLPTKEDFQELYDNTDNEWITINGIAGRKFMKKSDHSVYVFFPANGNMDGTTLGLKNSRGYYWSASFYNSSTCFELFFTSATIEPQRGRSRYLGFGARAVFNP